MCVLFRTLQLAAVAVVLLCSRRDLTASGASLDALRAAASGHSLDAWCVAYNCPGQSYACAADSECRRCLACLHGCGSSEACSAACLYRCGAERLLTEFLGCAVARYRCVQLQAPGGTSDGGDVQREGEGGGDDAECSGVGTAAALQSWGSPATLKEVRGRWFAVRGGHPFHDCHQCRSERFDPDAGLVVGSFRFESTAVAHSRRVVAGWPENGTLLLGLEKVGQAVTEVWRLSWPRGASRDLLAVSYCGSAGVWRYRGRLLLSRRLPRRDQQTSTEGGFACGVEHDADCRRMLPDGEAWPHDSQEL